MKLPSQEEKAAIDQFIVLPLVVQVVEKNRNQIPPGPLHKLHAAAADALLVRICSDLAAIKKELRNRNIKVWQDERDKLQYWYTYLGYEHQLLYMRDVLRSEIRDALTQYIGSLFKGKGGIGDF